ncbi:MAG: energy transducer TonB [candidate division Zixibacteria bacterium]|nr:energy transducer TonB [candidate division Zixibacteria bacterium]
MKKSNDISRPKYGAFELKVKYRRNMLLGTLFSSLLAIATTAGAFLFTQTDNVIIEIDPRVNPDDGRVYWEEPPIRVPQNPKGGRGFKPPQPDSRGPIVMVEDDEPIDDNVIAASLFDPYYTGPIGDDTGDIGSYIDIGDYGNGGDGYPEPTKFVFCEKMAEMIYEFQPEYPRLAQKAGMGGVVWIKALIDVDGSVRDAIILKSSNSNAGFDEAALKAAYKCKYSPGIQNDRSVPVWVSYAVEFVLEGSL